MRKMPSGGVSAALSSSGARSSTRTPRPSRCLPVRRRISASSLSRPGECSRSRKRPQYVRSLPPLLLLGSCAPLSSRERLRRRHVQAAVHVHHRLDDLAVERLAPPVEPLDVFPHPPHRRPRSPPPPPPRDPQTPRRAPPPPPPTPPAPPPSPP